MSELKSFLEEQMAYDMNGGRAMGRPAGHGLYENTLLRANLELGYPISTRTFVSVMEKLNAKKVGQAAAVASLRQLHYRGAIEKLVSVDTGLIFWWHKNAGAYDTRKFQPHVARDAA